MDNMLYRMDRRRYRADALTAVVLDEIRSRNFSSVTVSLDIVADVLKTVFRAVGVEVLTDAARAEMGLPDRDALGWTAEEIADYERRLRDALTKIPSAVVAKENT